MLKGTVNWFHQRKGYGFLTQENGTDIFVHYKSIKGEGIKTLTKGQQVEFEIKEGLRGPQAVNVTGM
jgi:CspA family cold shock protein